MAKFHTVSARWFAEADAADNLGKELPPNGVTVTLRRRVGDKKHRQFYTVEYNGTTYCANGAHLKSLTKGVTL